MKHAVLPKRETAAGLTMIGIGLFVIFEATRYTVGTGARMGPGYFPLLLGAILALLGLIIAFSTDSEEEEKSTLVTENAAEMKAVGEQSKPVAKRMGPLSMVDAAKWDRLRGMGAIVGGILAFMLIGRYGGLVPATFALVFISAIGDTNNRVLPSIILAIGVTILGTLIFHWGLQLQFPLFRWG